MAAESPAANFIQRNQFRLQGTMLKLKTYKNQNFSTEMKDGSLHNLPNARQIKRSLKLQKILGWIAFPALSAIIILILRQIQNYRVLNLRQLRKDFKQIASNGKPVIICPNHLTMVDSVIIQYALAPMWKYFFQFRLFAWNIPAKENFSSSVFLRIITYLSKCIPIDRQGSEMHIQGVLEKVDSILKSNETFMIFPEGKRSRTGRIETEEVTYGVGKILQNNPNALVLCVYCRGREQTTYSTIPVRKEKFYIKIKAISPKTNSNGLRGQRDLSVQIIQELKSMEEDYEKSIR